METKNTEKASGGQDIIEKVRNAKGYEDMIDIYKHWNTYDQVICIMYLCYFIKAIYDQ